MLSELRVQNLLLIESAELVLDRGLNVITGETGAGKTMLAHALDLLLGGKPRRSIVRPGAEEAYVEGVFTMPEGIAEDPELAELAERLPLDSDELVLARRVTAAGRTRAYLQGRSVTAAELAAVGARLLVFFGQHEHRRLVLASAQLEILDAYCGEQQVGRRRDFEQALRRGRAIVRELEDLRERLGMRDRDLDLLEFEIEEIESVGPSEDEKAALESERSRLASVETLREAASAAVGAIEQESEYGAVGATRSSRASRRSSDVPSADDAGLDPLAERAASLLYELQDLSREVHGYLGGLEADPERLNVVEERLDLYTRLERKHGGSVTTVLEHAEHCRAERERLVNAGAETARLEGELETTIAEVERLAGELTQARREGAAGLAEAVALELEQVAMDDARFEVCVTPRGAPEADPLAGYAATGADSVEFLIAPNPGVASRTAARDRIGRRALARDARAHDGRDGRRRRRHRRVRRGRRGPRRRNRAGSWARSSARSPRSRQIALHHAPAAGRLAGRAPLPRREGIGHGGDARKGRAPGPPRGGRRALPHARRRLRRPGSAPSCRNAARGRVESGHRPRLPGRRSRGEPVPAKTTSRPPDAPPGQQSADSKEGASRRPSFGRSPLEVHGKARLGRRTKDLVKRLGPEDVAIIDHRDLDRMAAEDLVESGVQGRRERRPLDQQPLSEPRAFDPRPGGGAPRRCGRGAFVRGAERRGHGDRPRRHGPRAERARRRGRDAHRETSWPRSSSPSRSGSARRFRTSPRTRSSHIRDEREVLVGKLKIPDLRTDFRDRHTLIVVRGTDYRRDLRAIRPYMRDLRPVLVGVDGGGDAILEAGLQARPDHRRHGLGVGRAS